MYYRFLPLLLIPFLWGFYFSSDKYPKDYFQAPVKSALRLSGTFGELRPNHFHAGIDIKGSVGTPLYSAAEGYVSRIKIQSGGYGKVLYITHPAGYTTVYAHMSKFTPKIEDYVKATQYEKQEFEVDLYPPKTLFILEQGERIGTMGVTGRSFGPHLHFEIRDAKTEKPINPLLFGLKVPDSRNPKMHQIRVYELDEKKKTLNAKSINLRGKNGFYGIPGDTITVASKQVGIALKVYDHMDGVRNWNGVYGIEMLKDDSLWHSFKLESFSFDESRYINAHLDYEEQVSKKSYFNRCFSLPGNRLSMYDFQKEEGIITVDKEPTQIMLVANDVEGNESKLKFWLKYEQKPLESEEDSFQYKLIHAQANLIQTNDIRIYFPIQTLYEDLNLEYEVSVDQSEDVFSKIHHIHNEHTPLHRYIDLLIKARPMTEEQRKKAFIAYCTPKNKIINCGGTWTKDNFLKAKVRDLGNYSILSDVTPPTIDVVSFKYNMKGWSNMKFKISDNYATARNVPGLKFEGTVDGEWILFELDAKNNVLTHRFDNQITPGEHQLSLIVTDNLGNQAVFERKFRR